MGYNTAVMLLNDRLHELRDDPNAGRKIYNAAITADRNGGDFQYGEVVPSHHADAIQVVLVGGNRIRTLKTLYYGSFDDNEAILRRLADEMGFRLVKKKSK